jgi:hypothetical protein
MTPEWRAAFEIITFSVGILGIGLAVVAIILSILFYRFSHTHESAATSALGKIEENTRVLGQIITKVLNQMAQRLGERPPSESPEFLLQVLQIVRPFTQTQAVPQINPAEVVSIQFQAQMFICVGYYAGLANLGLQSCTVADYANPTPVESQVLQLLTITQADCHRVVNALGNPQYQAAIPQTSVVEWYHALLQMLPSLRTEAEFRAQHQPPLGG